MLAARGLVSVFCVTFRLKMPTGIQLSLTQGLIFTSQHGSLCSNEVWAYALERASTVLNYWNPALHFHKIFTRLRPNSIRLNASGSDPLRVVQEVHDSRVYHSIVSIVE